MKSTKNPNAFVSALFTKTALVLLAIFFLEFSERNNIDPEINTPDEALNELIYGNNRFLDNAHQIHRLSGADSENQKRTTSAQFCIELHRFESAAGNHSGSGHRSFVRGASSRKRGRRQHFGQYGICGGSQTHQTHCRFRTQSLWRGSRRYRECKT